ncbi:MAG: hypothetical protein K8823_1146 [Cenarchaeum symbiont of Oopsacas minuta]|nr:hypothetical protein [Cenarchaeum symbiont of Oopsacas minuta]
MNKDSCKHQVTYYGVININIYEKTIGSVDVWRCSMCKCIFCEEKQLGIEAITDIVGMPKIEPDERWAVTVCRLQKGKEKWNLVKIKENTPLQHECLGESVMSLNVADYKIDNADHWSFLVKDNVNKAVEIQNEP